MDITQLSEHDRRLVETARRVTNPIDWWDVPKEEEAEAPEVKEYLHNKQVYLYLQEEGENI